MNEVAALQGHGSAEKRGCKVGGSSPSLQKDTEACNSQITQVGKNAVISRYSARKLPSVVVHSPNIREQNSPASYSRCRPQNSVHSPPHVPLKWKTEKQSVEV